ncbi:MAG: hypothetical protein H7840_12595 [Alphaproteobacteria bacterium]
MLTSRHLPKGYGGTRRSADDVKRDGWREQGLLAVAVDDPRLSWPEREMLHQLGQKLYGPRPKTREACHG